MPSLAGVMPKREAHAPADAGAVNRRDHRLGAMLDRIQRRRNGFARLRRRFRRRIDGREFRNVRACREGPGIAAMQDHHFHVICRDNSLDQLRYRRPHVDRQRIALARLVENDLAERRIDLETYGRLAQTASPAWAPRRRGLALSWQEDRSGARDVA